MFNTVKAILRFFKSVVRKYSPLKSEDRSIEDIVNHLNHNDTYSSSGQPTKQQLFLIQKAGYAVVINLAPYDFIENPLKNEATIVTKLGLKYVHISVNMLQPTQENFDTFVTAMQTASGEKIWIHCAVGMRASAFLYKYRCVILGEDKQTALWDLREIWEPFGAWKKFLFAEDD
jgi:protein tyrosine phosphatase (PTP) superfamily phosphohydrolase (DUF442 family)